MSLSPTYKNVRKVVLSALLSADAANTFFDAAQLADIANHAACLGEEVGSVRVDATMITASFLSDAAESEFSLDLENLGVGYDGSDIIYVYKSKQLTYGGPYTTAIGRFDSIARIEKPETVRGSIRHKSFGAPPDKAKRELVKFLERKRKRDQANAEKERAKAAAAEEERKRAEAAAEAAAAEAQSRKRPSEADQRKAKRQRHKEMLLSLEVDYRDLVAKLEAVDTQRAQLIESLAEIKEKMQVAKRDRNAAGDISLGVPGAASTAPENAKRPERLVVNSVGEGDEVTLLYLCRGRAGLAQIAPGGALLYNEIQNGLVPLPAADTDSEKARDARARKNYELGNHGRADAWVPVGSQLKATNKQSTLMTCNDQVQKLHYLFSKDKCMFSREAMRYITGGGMLGYGCSDRAMIMIMAGTVRAILHELQIRDISSDAISRGLPSRALLATAEHRFTADCYVVMRQEMDDDDVETIAGTFDHGHRKKQEHFVKNGHYAGRDEQGRPTIKSRVIDVDSSTHSAADCADAIKLSFGLILDRFDSDGEEDDIADDKSAESGSEHA